ncbi:hypothetical protein EC991_003970 [Linnemannia zychae]|nr:hypothetical protein EC991_003970 [Linnemannia zychae]
MDVEPPRRDSKRYFVRDFLQLTPIASLDLPATMNSAIPGRGTEATLRNERIDPAVDVVTALDLALPDLRGTIGHMETIETTGTTGTGTGSTESTEKVVITVTATTGTAEGVDPGNAALVEAGVQEAMVEGSIVAEDLLPRLQMKQPVTEEQFLLCNSLLAFALLNLRLSSLKLAKVGYVEFYDEDSVATAIALTGQKLLGIPVIAKHTESEKNRLALQAASQAQDAAAETAAQSPVPDLSQHRLYVGSVSFDLTEDDLKLVFEQFGPIEFIKLHRDAETGKSKGFAFVQYKEADHAKQAMERMNGEVLHGRTIKVGLVTEKGSTTNTNHTTTNGYQYNNGQINNSISMDDSDTAGYAMTSQSRVDLMQKLARGDGSMGGVPPSSTIAPAPVPSFVPPRQLPVVMPSRAVLLKNMFTEEDKTEPEWAKELEEDVKEEAEKSGSVVHIHVQQDTVGEIFLKFDTVQSATNAVQTLGGRFFAGRQIVAAFLPEMLYNVRFPSAANL